MVNNIPDPPICETEYLSDEDKQAIDEEKLERQLEAIEDREDRFKQLGY